MAFQAFASNGLTSVYLAKAVLFVKVVTSNTVMFFLVIDVWPRVGLLLKTSCYHLEMLLMDLKWHHHHL